MRPPAPGAGPAPARVPRSGWVLLVLAVLSPAPALLVPFGGVVPVVVAVLAGVLLPLRGARRRVHLAALAVAVVVAVVPVAVVVAGSYQPPALRDRAPGGP